MIVTPITLTPQISEINGVKPQEIENEAVISDKVSISSKAREIQQKRIESKELAERIMSTTPDIRTAKVSEAIERINNNSVPQEEVINTVAQRMAKMMGLG
ncbi:MAG: flagellar biosynthesis anti-sigma factor FlgM [Nitrospirota bacterium]